MDHTTYKPENLFLKTGNNTFSYEDLVRFSVHFSKIIEPYNSQKRRPIGLLGQPTDGMVLIIASCWIHDISFVVFNHHLPAQKIKQQIDQLNPELVITEKPEKVKDCQILSFDSFKPDKILTESPKLDQESFDETLEKITSDKESIFAYFFTSGTSSAPKIVPLKRRQMISAAQSSADNILPSSDECWLLCMPLFHVGGVSIILRSLFYGSAIFHTTSFEEEEIVQFLSTDTNIVVVSLVPTMLKRILENQTFTIHNDFKAVLLGGGPVSNDLIKTSIDRNIPVITSYGMTETCAQIAANPILESPDKEEKWQSAGRVFQPNEIEVRDEQNQPIPTGTSGTIWIAGPQVFDGYIEKGSDNSEKINWFNTGDFGRVDEDGRLFIEARRTDLIITGGENVSPKEVEQALINHKKIQEVAAFGKDDDEWGEKVMAAVVVEAPAKITSVELKAFLKAKLASYKIPKQFILVDEIPRTYNGKIQRYKLKELLQ